MAGPDLLFVLKSCDTKQSQMSDRIICTVQLKTGDMGYARLRDAIKSTSLYDAYEKAKDKRDKVLAEL